VDLKDDISRQEEVAEESFTKAYDMYREALDLDNSNADARGAMIELLKIKYNEAQERNDGILMRLHLKEIEKLATNSSIVQWEYLAKFTITTIPDNAAVYLYPIDDRGMEWFHDTNRAEHLDYTPINAQRKPGNYLIQIKHKDYKQVDFPLCFEPGCRSSFVVPLYTEMEIGKDFVYIPRGPAIIGGGGASVESKKWGKKIIKGFFISRYEVTLKEYMEFLNGIASGEDGENKARKHIPRNKNGVPYPNWDINMNNSVIVGVDESWASDWPIFGVSFSDAKPHAASTDGGFHGATFSIRPSAI